jgi:hypothetical protein
MKRITWFSVPAALLLAGLGACVMERQAEADSGMSFFITSVGAGQGADLGGLEGADRHCQQLAQSAGAGDRTWRAYLSTQAAGGQPAINARDRIGRGPWQNAKATIIARDVNELHNANNLTKETALTEKGDVVSGRGDTPNRHDILTDPNQTVRRSLWPRTGPAATGPGAVRKERPWLATTTAVA